MKRLELGLIGLLGVSVASALTGRTYASLGQLEIKNTTNSSAETLGIIHGLPGAEEGLDFTDSFWLASPAEGPNIYGEVEDTRLCGDSRPETNTFVEPISLAYTGTVTSPIDNWLEVSFPYAGYEFGDKPLVLNNGSRRFDVRRAIEQNGGVIPLEPIAPGTYTADNPYATLVLRFDRWLGDVNNDGKVDIRDYDIITRNWAATGEGVEGDISGPNGIPDGIVDSHDFKAFLEDLEASQPLESR